MVHLLLRILRLQLVVQLDVCFHGRLLVHPLVLVPCLPLGLALKVHEAWRSCRINKMNNNTRNLTSVKRQSTDDAKRLTYE